MDVGETERFARCRFMAVPVVEAEVEAEVEALLQ
jgi:hypothetical protein